MAEPKKRTNKSKTNMRRMHHKASRPAVIFCGNCHEPVLRHHVCKFCGYYRGKKVIEIKDKTKRVEETTENK